jgi:hypothetical protein
MKYNLDSMLPIRAFKPRSGGRFTSFGSVGMTLEGGGGGFISDIVESVTSPFEQIGEAVSDVAQTISDVGVQVDKSVGEAVPGGWATVGAVVATVVTMGAASELLIADLAAEGALAAEVAADAAMAAETAGALEAGVEAATIGAEAAVEAGADLAVAAGESTSIATEVGSTVAETIGEGAQIAGENAWTAEVAATQEAAQQAALQQAAQNAGLGALKGAGMNALSSVVRGQDITPEGLLKGAVTGGVGAGIGGLASNSLADYGSTISRMGGSLAGGLSGGTIGAALNGGDIGQGILSGGISGLAGATSIGAGAGLQEAGLDPTTARMLSGAAIGAGKAAINGGDPLMGAAGSLAGNALNIGTNAAGNALYGAAKDAGFSSTGINNIAEAQESPEQKLTQLAASNVMSDASPSPMEEAIGSVSVTGAPPQTEQEKQYTQQLMEALYPNIAVQGTEAALQAEKDAVVTPQDLSNIDSTGNIYDKSGAVVSSAVELGLIKGTDAQGNDVWVTQTGDFIPVTTENQSTASNIANQVLTPAAGTTPETSGVFGTGPSEASSDNPQEIINNADGSVTIIENDGTQRIFNVDGSVTIIDINGKSSEEFGPAPAAPAEATPSSSSSGSSMLGNLASSLLGPTLAGSMGKTGSPSKIGGGGMGWLPAAAGIGAGIGAGYAAANAPTQDSNPYTVGQYGFDWNQQAVNPVDTGVAYGQQFFNPQFTKTAADGGLMSIPNSVTPTVGENGFLDPTSSVQMYSKGGNVDNETMQIVKHLKSGGAPMHHIAGFLEYRNKKMAQGGSLGSYSDGGRLLKGLGDGMSDDIPASIAGVQPARLANEEFVIPADVVSHLGNGSSEAGAKVLYDMLDKVRKARTGHTKQGKQINPDKLMPKARK